MLVHICCSVDSHYFLQKIQEDYKDEPLIGFFYDPNIHPYSEYLLRYEDVKHSCKILGIDLIQGDYDLETWMQLVKGMEDEPEKGDRCTVCYDRRLDVSVKKAIELGHNSFTSTLLISPKKSQEKLDIIGNKLTEQTGCQWIFKDYKKGDGAQQQAKEVKNNHLYRQNYCGCLYGLIQQREQQNKLLDEMFNSINAQILPESIEERLELYRYRNQLTETGQTFSLIKQRFLNYRILYGSIKIQKQFIPSYFLCYSTLKSINTHGRIETIYNEIAYLNRDEMKFITLNKFNTLADTNYKNIQELYFNPLPFNEELKVRNNITNNAYDISCIAVIENFKDVKYEVVLNSKTYEDVKEEILLHK